MIKKNTFLITVFSLLSFSFLTDNDSFNKDSFVNRKYSKEEIMLFCDIGFRESNIIRKWETDINVEIKNIDSLSQSYITDVDSCIAILAPLIKPVKIRRVKSDGNLVIFYFDKMPLKMGMATGYCKLNDVRLSHQINYAELLISKRADASVLLHELEHAIGLAHNKRKYPYILNITSRENPVIFKDIDEYLEYSKIKYPISKQEKEVILMLYSNDFKSGLNRKTFMEAMNIEEVNIWK